MRRLPSDLAEATTCVALEGTTIKATFWRLVADGTIPRPVKIDSMSRWPKSEIDAVIDWAKAQRGV
jgi:predicted DNA-binding transcriptional regulator AlpA